jgi:hypothetical protein
VSSPHALWLREAQTPARRALPAGRPDPARRPLTPARPRLRPCPAPARGSASDNNRVYVANNNFFSLTLDPTKLRGVPNTPGATSAPSTANGGMVAALVSGSGPLGQTGGHQAAAGAQARRCRGLPLAAEPLLSPAASANSCCSPKLPVHVP